MTCIVGVVDPNNYAVWMGGDSAGVDGGTWTLQTRADPKVFRVGHYLIGFTSSFRMGQLLQYELRLPDRDRSMPLHEHMVKRFVPAVRECLKIGGYAKKENEVESGGVFMVGFESQLFTIWDDYQVASPVEGYCAIGCGRDIALGALCVTLGELPETRIKKALQAAEHFNAAVRSPFTIRTTP